MAKKNPYRAISVKDLDITKLDRTAGDRTVVGIDIAKEGMKASVLNGDGTLLATVKWNHPTETETFKDLLQGLGAETEVVAESTGSYGIALMESIGAQGYPTFMVGTKRSHDAAEVFDGVGSQHDAKDAYLLGRLHLNDCSRPWPERSEEQRNLQAQVRQLDAVQQRYQQQLGRLEALVAVYWPGVTKVLDLDSTTLWALLERLCWSGAIAAEQSLARRIMREVGRYFLSADKVSAVVQHASIADGLKPTSAEEEELRSLIGSLRNDKKAVNSQRKRIAELGQENDAVCRMAPLLGGVTAAILLSEVGDPRQYGSSAAYVKAIGLNLKERSSGQHQGQLKITKRGPGRARQYLYLASLRLLRTDAVVAAWYDAKVQRDGGKRKMKAVVAVMRKLARSLIHVAQGEAFDATKLFDARKLQIVKQAA